MTAGIDGTVAIVTGAAGGIGTAVVRALTAAGASVAAVDTDQARLDALAVLGAGAAIRPYLVDVRDTAAVEDLVATVERQLGPVGILVNVAGILRVGAVATLTDDDWTEVFDVNLHGVVRCCRAVAGRMAARGRGSIVTVASNAAAVPRINMAAYAASKAATVHFMRCLALEVAGSGVRCNTVSPGSTDTDMQRALWGPQDAGDAAARAAASAVAGAPELYRLGIPLRRLAQPQDVAHAVVFLAGDTARHITMHDLCVDGGAALGH